MDTLVFIATLGVAAAVVCWYLANEVARGDGGKGLLALHDELARAESAPFPEAGARYRRKPRLAPARRASATPAPCGKAYRPAPTRAPVRSENSQIMVDDDY